MKRAANFGHAHASESDVACQMRITRSSMSTFLYAVFATYINNFDCEKKIICEAVTSSTREHRRVLRSCSSKTKLFFFCNIQFHLVHFKWQLQQYASRILQRAAIFRTYRIGVWSDMSAPRFLIEFIDVCRLYIHWHWYCVHVSCRCMWYKNMLYFFREIEMVKEEIKRKSRILLYYKNKGFPLCFKIDFEWMAGSNKSHPRDPICERIFAVYIYWLVRWLYDM